jgi:hypothetical protein
LTIKESVGEALRTIRVSLTKARRLALGEGRGDHPRPKPSTTSQKNMRVTGVSIMTMCPASVNAGKRPQMALASSPAKNEEDVKASAATPSTPSVH